MAIAALILALLGILAVVVFFWLYVTAIVNIDQRLMLLEDRMDVINVYIQTPDA